MPKKPIASLTPQELAEAATQAMWQADKASQHLGMRLEKVRPGYALVSMIISQTMLNGHGTCHGGYLFTLADSAFAFACNSYNQAAVAQHCSISFLAPGRGGDHVTAEAKEVVRQGRTGIYDIAVRNQHGDVIAEFRGHSRTIQGTHISD